MSSQIALQRTTTGPDWLGSIRESAVDAFSSMEWPRPDEEEWRRTSLESLDLDVLSQDGGHGATVRINGPDQLAKDGGCVATYQGPEPPENVRGLFSELLAKSASEIDNRFLAWNIASCPAGVLVYVPDGMVLEDPIVVEYTANDEVSLVHTAVVLGKNAKATVILRYGGKEQSVWNGAVTASVDDGSELALSETEEASDDSSFIHHTRVFLSRDSRLVNFDALLGAHIVKVRTEVALEGPGADAKLNGLYFARQKQHMDVRTVQYHRNAHGDSRALYKGAVSAGGRSIYQGLIDVDHEAVGTDAYLTNKNLILGDGARADSIPCLEIRTNDVKCSHGSTSGKINEDELYYLMSRGIKREDAIRDIVVGYFEEAIATAPAAEQETLRNSIENIVKDGAI